MLQIPNDQLFKTTPMQHQIKGLLQSRDREFFALLLDMGLGKSKIIIDTASYLFGSGKINGLVVIGPKSALRSWSEQQLPTHMPNSIECKTVVWGSQSKALDNQLKSLFQVEPLKLHTLIMNVDAVITDRGYDILEKFLRAHDALLVVDESTNIKNPRSSRTKVLTKLGKLARYRRILTGTPIANRPIDVYAQFQFLSDGCLGSSSWFAFRNRYAVTKTMYFNGRKVETIIGWQRLDELFNEISKHSYRVLKKDCLDLPDKIYQTRHIELAPEQRKYYEEMRDLALTELSSGALVAAPLVITRILRLRQSLCNLAPSGEGDGTTTFISDKDPRLTEVLALLEETGDQKFIIWSCFTASILKLVEAINKEFGEGTTAAFYGGVSTAQRQQLINDLQGDTKLRGLVMQSAVGSEAITCTAATVNIYHDNDWSLRLRQQSEDRTHRIGQTRSVLYVDLVAADTIDETIVSALRDKKDLAQIVTGDNLRQLLAGGVP